MEWCTTHSTLFLPGSGSSLFGIYTMYVVPFWYVYNVILRENQTGPTLTWISLRCPSNWSIWLFFIINLSLYLIYKVNNYVCTQKKTEFHVGFGTESSDIHLELWDVFLIAFDWGRVKMSLLLEGCNCAWLVLKNNALKLPACHGVLSASQSPVLQPAMSKDGWLKVTLVGTDSWILIWS